MASSSVRGVKRFIHTLESLENLASYFKGKKNCSGYSDALKADIAIVVLYICVECSLCLNVLFRESQLHVLRV